MWQEGSAQHQYVDGQVRPAFPELLARFQAESDALAAGGAGTLGIRHGPHEREVFDFFAAETTTDGAARGTVLYLHAGYWQARDKSLFRFLAPAFTRRALNVALLNYPLCPTVTIAEIIDSVRRAVVAVAAQVQRQTGQRDGVLLAVGHSAGAHLAVELALSRFDAPGLRARPIDGVIAISGVYDLAPLPATTLNDKLRLDAAAAHAASPLHRAAAACPALFIVGGAETAAFLHQSAAMHEAWRAAGNAAELLDVPGADHFSVLEDVIGAGPVGASVDRLIGQATGRRAG